jgi:hypothetical protein
LTTPADRLVAKRLGSDKKDQIPRPDFSLQPQYSVGKLRKSRQALAVPFARGRVAARLDQPALLWQSRMLRFEIELRHREQSEAIRGMTKGGI